MANEFSDLDVTTNAGGYADLLIKCSHLEHVLAEVIGRNMELEGQLTEPRSEFTSADIALLGGMGIADPTTEN